MPDTTATQTSYSIASWVRRGIGTLVTGQAAASYASLPVSVSVNGAPVNAPPIRLMGPGDVTGLDARAVIRTDPRDTADAFEPNYLAMVELALPDLPWMFTPSGDVNGYLQPWICLIVVPDAPGATIEAQAGGLSVLTLDSPLDPKLELPDLDTIGFWAHAQVVGTGASGDDLNAAFDGDTPATLSRLISPRRLQANQGYIACIVPTYHAGVNAALGLPVDDSDVNPAWNSSVSAPFTLPVYYYFRFHTGMGGDFGSLARNIKPATVNITATRTMDVSAPGFGIPALPGPSPGLPGPTLELEGALRKVDPADTTANPPALSPAGVEATYEGALRTSLTGESATPPVVSPPIYGDSQSSIPLFPATAAQTPPVWLGDLNFDPRTRAAAAAGAQVVQKNQDALVASAWEQVGELRNVNRLLSQGQLAQEVSYSLLKRHLQTVTGEGVFLQMTAPLHSRVIVAGASATLRGSIASSILPAAAVSAAMRKVSRSRGPIGRQVTKGTPQIIERLNLQPSVQGALQVAAPISPPRGMVAFDRVDLKSSTTFQISKMLGVFEVATGVKIQITDGPVISDRGASGEAEPHAPLPTTQPTGPAPVTPIEPDPTPTATATFANWNANVPMFLKTSSANLPAPLVVPTAPADLTTMQAQFQSAASRVIEYLGTAPPAETPAPSLPATKDLLQARLDPATTIPARLRPRIPLGNGPDPLQPMRTGPEFPSTPMFTALADLSPEWMLPGISAIPIDAATLMESNARFIESYMVGLNEELSRELLWRQFPADLHFTYFSNFWSSTKADIPPIQNFDPSEHLGDHVNSLASGKTVVLLVRANLFRRYPNAVVSLAQAKWVANPKGTGQVRTLAGPFNYPAFRGEIGSDVTFFGFSLESLTGDPALTAPLNLQGPADLQGSADPAAGKPGWYFVIEEHLTEPRFGLEPDEVLGQESTTASTAPAWSDLSWQDIAPGTFLDPAAGPTKYPQLEGVTWGANAASMAYILMREPVRVALHALALLEPQETNAVTL